MDLKSVDRPAPARTASPFESRSSQPTVVRDGAPGAETGGSRAAQFLVAGTRKEPLRAPARNVFESILGDVDRRKQILETDLAPWRMICSLQIINNNNLEYVGTGWFAGPRTIITAGHCVFDPVELGGWAKRINVVPGRNGDATLGSVESTQYSTTDRWLEAQDADYDYAAIHLSDDVGSTAGSFGLAVMPDAELVGRMVNISGYPASPGEGRLQYFHANRVKAVTERRLFYDVDTMGGQSGSPVWAYLDDDVTKPFVVGIHAYGIGGTPSDLGVVANSGPRLLPEVLSVIEAWVAKSSPS